MQANRSTPTTTQTTEGTAMKPEPYLGIDAWERPETPDWTPADEVGKGAKPAHWSHKAWPEES